MGFGWRAKTIGLGSGAALGIHKVGKHRNLDMKQVRASEFLSGSSVRGDLICNPARSLGSSSSSSSFLSPASYVTEAAHRCNSAQDVRNEPEGLALKKSIGHGGLDGGNKTSIRATSHRHRPPVRHPSRGRRRAHCSPVCCAAHSMCKASSYLHTYICTGMSTHLRRQRARSCLLGTGWEVAGYVRSFRSSHLSHPRRFEHLHPSIHSSTHLVIPAVLKRSHRTIAITRRSSSSSSSSSNVTTIRSRCRR
ncbi:hypothetical protein F4780DRAFT_767093 [Xylariomycetidae sp. FL0641]|nr:hypothetical protein F4780DRAFT_767093 [Xylariomycetidae sp. FL0641]